MKDPKVIADVEEVIRFLRDTHFDQQDATGGEDLVLQIRRYVAALENLQNHARNWHEATTAMINGTFAFDEGDSKDAVEVNGWLQAACAKHNSVLMDQNLAANEEKREEIRRLRKELAGPLSDAVLPIIQKISPQPGDIVQFIFDPGMAVATEHDLMPLVRLKFLELAGELGKRVVFLSSRRGQFDMELLRPAPDEVIVLHFPSGASEQHMDGIPHILRQALEKTGNANSIVSIRDAHVERLYLATDDLVVLRFAEDATPGHIDRMHDRMEDAIEKMGKANIVVSMKGCTVETLPDAVCDEGRDDDAECLMPPYNGGIQ